MIRRLMVKKRSIPDIAKLLGKHRTSIWREVKRNTNAGGIYYDVHAEALLRRRRLKSREKFRIVENDLSLEAFIERLLKQLHADEAAGRLNGRPRKRFNFEAPRRLFAKQTGKSPFFTR